MTATLVPLTYAILTVEVMCVENGKIRRYQHRSPSLQTDPPDFDDYIWSEGNYACDCNRYKWFYRPSDGAYVEHFPCSDSKFKIRVLSASGDVLYDEIGGD